ncbi:MAG: hypothetical protein K2G97_03880, partial [Oscillospiraceae bacterium]|nr:hypothetical protein [Oscillospiraceae bacterium]
GKNAELSFINTLNEYAEIKNVKFDNYTIEGKSKIKKAAGLIVTNHGTISDVDVINGSINNIDEKANAAGFVLNNEEDGVIENCFLGMNTKNSNIKSGFVGTNLGKITKCSTTVLVNSKDIAGGFCGSNSGEISDCKSEGMVKATAKKGVTICGGFVAENDGIIKNCSSTGAVEGQEFTGGFAGINGDKGEISFCKAKCDVKSHTYIASINCGGFVGVDGGRIEDCSFDGKVDGCVDSEKVLGIGLGVAVATIFIIISVYLYNKINRDTKYVEKTIGEPCNDASQAVKIVNDVASSFHMQKEKIYTDDTANRAYRKALDALDKKYGKKIFYDLNEAINLAQQSVKD